MVFDPSKIVKKMIGNGVKVPKFGKSSSDDLDGDGISNKKDCQPKNIFRQDILEVPGDWAPKVFGGVWRNIEGSKWLPNERFAKNYKLWEKIIPGRSNAYILAVPNNNGSFNVDYFEQDRGNLGTVRGISNYKSLGSNLSPNKLKEFVK